MAICFFKILYKNETPPNALFTMFSIFFITAVTADHYYCFKKTPGLAKGLIYGTSICYEVTLKSTDEYTFTWNNPERKHIIPNNISDFGVGCADLKEYMNGGDCWGAVETNVNCGIIHGRLEYWNSVLPVSNYVKTFLDYFHVAEKATRMFPTMPRSLCKNITGGIECSAGQKGIIQWY
jgi:hypothetical protein